LKIIKKRLNDNAKSTPCKSLASKKAKIQVFIEEFFKAAISGKRIIFIDEMGVDSSLLPFELWGFKGRRLKYHRKANKDGRLVIGACFVDKIIGYKTFKVAVNATSFGAFVIDLATYLQSQDILLNSCVIVLDNATIHHANSLTPLRSLVRFLYLPPYCPQFNFIELLFSAWKHNIREMNHVETDETIDRVLFMALRRISNKRWLKLQLEYWHNFFREADDALKEAETDTHETLQ